MAYRDPYTNHYGSGSFPQQQNPTQSIPGYQTGFRQQHETYEQDGYDPYSSGAGYRDDAPGQHYDDYDPSIGGPGTYPPVPQREPSRRTNLTRGKSEVEGAMALGRTPTFPDAFKKERYVLNELLPASLPD